MHSLNPINARSCTCRLTHTHYTLYMMMLFTDAPQPDPAVPRGTANTSPLPNPWGGGTAGGGTTGGGTTGGGTTGGGTGGSTANQRLNTKTTLCS